MSLKNLTAQHMKKILQRLNIDGEVRLVTGDTIQVFTDWDAAQGEPVGFIRVTTDGDKIMTDYKAKSVQGVDLQEKAREAIEVLFRERKPMPGDAVRLTAPYSITKPGSIGIIGGVVGRYYPTQGITFNASAFRGRSSTYSEGPMVVSCSGGPGTIGTNMSRLKPTTETIMFTFWHWKDTPRAGGGTEYQLEIPQWEWDGSDETK